LRETFGDVGVALPVVDDEAPEEPGDEVEEVGADAVAQPRPRRVRQAAPPAAGRHRAENDLVVPPRLRDEAAQVVAAVLHCGRHCRRGCAALGRGAVSLVGAGGGVKQVCGGLKWICVLPSPWCQRSSKATTYWSNITYEYCKYGNSGNNLNVYIFNPT
jgi:hypothetical protein